MKKKFLIMIGIIIAVIVLYIPGYFLINEINLQIKAYQGEQSIYKILEEKGVKKSDIYSFNKNVGLVEEETTFHIVFKDERDKEYTFYTIDGKVYQDDQYCGDEVCNEGWKDYALSD